MPAKITLREMLKRGPVLAPCVYDCVSATLVKEAGFKAMCVSGAEVAASQLGVPDIGLLTASELEDTVRRINTISDLPMIVDIDTGYGNELNTINTCRRIARAGAMAVHLEDQTFPKRCGHLTGKEVIPLDDYIAKVRAAVDALKGTDCMLIARTDAYAVNGIDDAIDRAIAAYEAGADITLVEGSESVEGIREIGRRVPGLKMFGMASGGASPSMSFDELVSMGYSLITFHYAMFAGIDAMRRVGQICYNRQDDSYLLDLFKEDPTLPHFYDALGLHDWLQLGKKYNPNIKDAYIKQCEV